MRKTKKEKEGFVVMIVELFFLVSGCIQSSKQINNLDVWGFFFFCVVTCFRWRKECFLLTKIVISPHLWFNKIVQYTC